jgi:hypothetical protein
MSHFAKIENGIVINVIVAEQDYIDTLENPSSWVQTSYNTFGGVHSLGKTPLRKNYARIGGTYDADRDAFIEQKPFASWSLNEDTCLWESPVPRPADEKPYYWDEDALNWIETTK